MRGILAVKVDKAKLEKAIKRAEADGPLPKQSDLWIEVSRIYNTLDPKNPTTKATVYHAVARLGLKVKTPKAKAGRRTAEERVTLDRLRDLAREALDALQREGAGRWSADDPGWGTVNRLRSALGMAPARPADRPGADAFPPPRGR